MKIKKVEIQAFRAYDKVKDCTFDFHTTDGKFADFISIYAPNGFGKTSFYDAVEWGITNNIYRFVRHSINKEYAQDEKNLKYEIDKGKSPQYFLRHKHSSEDLPGFVKLFLANPDEEKSRSVPVAARVDSRDYDFEDKKTENAYFRKVILSQDGIDSFLKEDKPEIRYQKFVEFFGDKELDICYTNILHLISANNAKIVTLQKQKTLLQNEIPLINDEEILNKVNTKIIELNSKGENLAVIDPDFSDNDFLNFSNLLTENKINVLKKINENQDKLNSFKIKESELETFFNSKSAVENYNNTLISLKDLKLSFSKLSELTNQINNKSRSIEDKINDLLIIEEIKNVLPSFYRITIDINNGKKRIEDDTINLNSKLAFFRLLQTDITDLKLKNEVLLNLIYNSESRLNDSYQIENFIKDTQTEIDLILTKIDSSSKLQLDLEKQLTELIQKSRSIEFEINQIKNNEIPNSIKKDENFLSIIFQIESKQKDLISKKNSLADIENRIAKYRVLKDDLNQITLLTINSIESSLTTKCPACGQEYNSHLELLDRIRNNSFLDQEYLLLTTNKSELNNLINEVNKEISFLQSQILSVKEITFEEIKNQISVAQQLRSESITFDSNNKKRLAYFENTKREQFLLLDGLSVLDFQNKLKELILKSNTDLETVSLELSNKNEAESHIEVEINTLRKSITLIEAEVKNLEISKDFIKVNKFLLKNNSLNLTNEESINNLIDERQRDIDNCTKELEILRAKRLEINEKISKHNENIVDNEIQLIEELVIKLKSDISAFTQFIISHFGIEFIELNFEDLSISFSNFIRGLALSVDSLNTILNDYYKVEEYKDNVIPFLKLRVIEGKIVELNDLIQFQLNISSILQSEKENLSAFINLQIESFFYEDLINKIYMKIDPHPEYKKIVFKCDFSGDVPKLNVFVNGSDTEHIIPNLYFSTAQMNILSLSIFLAKALNAKDDNGNPIDCIFIDDPIQSMDSINILSTIDLLRSISFNLNKQIILSTHEENFHKLLKRKIPTNKFNSKFIELETFGKVKK